MRTRSTSVNIDKADAKKLEWYNVYVRAVYETSKSSKNKRKLRNALRLNGAPILRSKEILHNVNGIAYPGRLLAIMGSSGAGKTTLLNVLTHRNLADVDLDGLVLVNGKNASKSYMRHISAYVQQDDCFVGTMTVKEHLMFSVSQLLAQL
ncbi:ABC transporter ATP-binding protein/permease wht-1 [Toxocara canis]|uniref:ABC transporter ATP-binding protein/permease wht-1 n=1 Tax=Toxocara canis TaxID=6265 RepID=A0A0B2UXS0_TOXCA|nr:ABC transporter ATP-binding protein/permease wht-1 [Toxocara canis]KHN74029.1 ABC transporter ATP-binding protein/permease wht-1 [Toxocara canis]